MLTTSFQPCTKCMKIALSGCVRYDCCSFSLSIQMLQSAGAVSRYMPRRRDAQTRTQTQMQADADAAAFSSATTWLGQRGVVRIYQLLQSENAVSQDTAHRHRPLLWFSGSGHCSFVFRAPKHGAQTRETANADQRCGSVKATRRCAASTFVRA